MRKICMSGSMSGVWKRSQGRTSEAPPDERGGNRYVRPTATAPHSDSTVGVGIKTADRLVHEVLSRPMRDQRAVARVSQRLPRWRGARRPQLRRTPARRECPGSLTTMRTASGSPATAWPTGTIIQPGSGTWQGRGQRLQPALRRRYRMNTGRWMAGRVASALRPRSKGRRWPPNARGTESLQTPCWSKADSNPRSHV
jgi:hypothetical protein